MEIGKACKALIFGVGIFILGTGISHACQNDSQKETYRKVFSELQLAYSKSLAHGGPALVDVNVIASYDPAGKITEAKLDQSTGSWSLDHEIIRVFKAHPTCPSENGGSGVVPIRFGVRR